MAGDEAEFSEDTKSTVRVVTCLLASPSLAPVLLCSFKRAILEI